MMLPHRNSTLKPVMVWIHGGGFIGGTNDPKTFGPEYIITKDVVLVSIHYRVGFLGFLTLEDTSLEVPGNAALKDQVLALKWVQKNIIHFNGDPNNVTIFGQSAGGGSVHYLVLSPTTKGLFHKAILQSGAALNPWTTSNLDIYDFMNFIGREAKNDKEALKILRDLPVKKLVNLQDEYLKTKPMLEIIGAVVEKPNPTAFLTKSPIEIMTSGEYNKIPMIIGYTSNEGVMFACSLFKTGSIANFIHPEMKIEKGSSIIKVISEKLQEYYSQEKYADNPYMLHTDYYFIAGIIGSAKIHAKTSNQPVYLYRLTMESEKKTMKKMINVENLPGVCHGEDTTYLFKTALISETEFDELEKQCIQQFLELWTNFAKYNNPTPAGNNLNIDWKPIEEEQVNILDIGRELIMETNPEAERMNFWKDIYHLSPETAKYL
ncbi:juvenile hormone esterase-like isoform X2 [Leptinotarsa decemlineata]|uniref:juvenile hormone esterase-like isoform X2 n=1 Tax=Leptinotarsa decemlineata TaxID=7539 RepID=UPI003D304400